MTGGINRFVDEALDDQCIEANDVWEKEGDLCRRPAFYPIGTNAPYLLGSGACVTILETLSPQSFVTDLVRQPSVDSTVGGATVRLWIGGAEPFDGVDWRNIAASPDPTTATGNARIKAMWRDASNNLSPIYGTHDTTKKLLLQNSGSPIEQFIQPFWKNGRFSWNKEWLTYQGWALSTLNSLSRYWVALDMSEGIMLPGETAPSSIGLPASTSIDLTNKGVHIFLLNPVNGLMPLHTKGSARVVVAGSDFPKKRGNCLGGGLGYLKSEYTETEIARIVEDEGSGTSGQVAAAAWGGGTWNDGTAGTITKNRRQTLDGKDYDWLANNASGIDVGQFDGAPVLRATAGVGSTTTAMVVPSNWEGPFNQNFENHRLRCVSTVGGGPAAGEEREIWSCDSTHIYVRGPFSAAPANTQVFEIRKPPSFVRTREGKRDYEILSNTQDALTLGTSLEFQNALGDDDTNSYVNFEIFKECFWALNPAVRWCACFDSVTGRLIMTNGENGLLEFDGLRTRRLRALWEPTPGQPGAAIVQLWRGIVQDLVTQHNDPNLLSGSDLRHSPPNGKYVVDFSGRLVVAHIRERSQSVIWSAPGGLNNIWPLTYEALVRDSDNGPITGLATIGDRLAVFTKTSIHLGSQPNERGEIYFKPAAQGVGFTAHAAVAKIAIGGQDALIGPGVDGIYIFNGGEPTAVLDNWKRVLKRGVNKGKLERACGAALHSESLYFLAVAEGGSDSLNKLIIVDYSAAPKAKVWVWTAPFKDSFCSIAREVKSNGDERILFGMHSGHVCALHEARFDAWGNGPSSDIDPFTPYARSKPIKIDGGRAAFSKLMLKFKPLGEKGVDIYTYVNRSDIAPANTTIELGAVDDAAIYGIDDYNDADANYWPPSMRTYPLNLPSGLVGEEISIEINSANQWRFGGASVLISPKGQKSQ